VTLLDLRPGDTAAIVSFLGDLEVQSRLVEMGILPGVRFRLVKVAPMKGPVELKIRDYYVSLRQSDAAHIEVQT